MMSIPELTTHVKLVGPGTKATLVTSSSASAQVEPEGGTSTVNVLRKPDTVIRIAQLSVQHALPVIGASFSGAMWRRDQHAAVLEDAERVISHLSALGGSTLGLSVGRAPQKKTTAQLEWVVEHTSTSPCFRRWSSASLMITFTGPV